MGLRAIRCLQPVVDRVVVAGRHDLPNSWDAHAVFGEREGSGPLGAILDAVQHNPARRVAVLPCDMPYVTSSSVESLENGCDLTTMVAAFASSTFLEEPQWLAACWNGEHLRDEIEELYLRGVRSVRAIAARFPHALIDLPASELVNLNSMADL